MNNKICSKCKESKLLNEFNKDKNRKDGLQPRCKLCRSKEFKKSYKGSVTQLKNHNTNKIRRKKWKTLFNDLKKNSKCCECGNDDYRLIEYHHIKPEEKLFSLSWFVTYHSFNNERIKEFLDEYDKCVAMCSNCHRIYHWENDNYS